MTENINQHAQTAIKKKRIDLGKTVFLISMLGMAVINFFIFYLGVNFDSILLAFRLPNGEFTMDNFKWAFQDFVAPDSLMLEALRNSLIFFFVIQIFMKFVHLCLSYFIYKKILGYKFFRVFFYVPTIISTVVIATLFKTMIGPNGPVTEFLGLFMEEVPEFYADSRYALGTLLVYECWATFGTGTIMIMGAMARIPSETLEAAQLDGCSPLRELFSLILPMIWPTLSTLLIMGFAGIFTSSGAQLLFTNGDYGTMTISFYIFDQVNRYQAYNQASAVGLIYTVVGTPLVLGGKLLLERIQDDVQY